MSAAVTAGIQPRPLSLVANSTAERNGSHGQRIKVVRNMSLGGLGWMCSPARPPMGPYQLSTCPAELRVGVMWKSVEGPVGQVLDSSTQMRTIPRALAPHVSSIKCGKAPVTLFVRAGFYTSRPTLKAYIRVASGLLTTLRKAVATLTMHDDCGLNIAVRFRCLKLSIASKFRQRCPSPPRICIR